MPVRLIAALCCWAVCCCLRGQGAPENELTPEDYQIRVWPANEGMAVNSITDIAQTPEGYLWAGTLLSGLLRFDGVSFTQFNSRNTPAILGTGVRRLMVDHAGLLWISTYDGALASWNHKGFTLVEKALGQMDALLYSRPGYMIFDAGGGKLVEGKHDGHAWRWNAHRVSETNPSRVQLCADKQGRAWCLRGPRELGIWENGVLKALSPPPGLEGQAIYALAADAEGGIWAGTDKGLMKWEDGRFVDRNPPGAGSPVLNIIPAGDSLWVQGPERLRRFAGGQWAAEAKDWAASYARRSLNFRFGDKTGAFWASNEGVGLIHVAPDGTIKTVSTREGLPSNSMKMIFPDRVGNIWIGYDRGGLVQLRPRYFQIIGRVQGLSNTVVNSVCEDAEGSVWIGTAGRVVTQFTDGKSINHPLPVADWARETVVTVDRENRIWAGCWNGGLLTFSDGKFVQAIPPNRLPGGDIRLMLPARDGRLWLGMLDSIAVVQDGVAKTVFASKDSVYWPAAIAEAADGTIWVGTFDGVLMRWDGNSFVVQDYPGPRFKGRFWSILPRTDGGLWIGTTENGLLRWKDGKFLQIGKAQGLYSSFVTAVQMDLAGNLWLITGAGLEKIPADALARFERGETQTLPVSRFSRVDGMNEGGGSFEFQPNCWRGRNGKLWFANGNSVVGVMPEGIQPNTAIPTVVIEELTVDDVRVWPAIPGQVISVSPDPSPRPKPPDKSMVTIPPGQHDLQFSFTALDCRAPQVLTFKYRLEGYETEWHHVREARRARYNSLPPGKYTFQLMAANNDAIWNENCATFSFEMLPFFYQTAWFRWALGICGVTLPALAVLLGLRRRMQRRLELLAHEQEKERDRARIAQDMHDEIGAKLTRISYLSELAKQADEASGPPTRQMNTISDLSRDLLQSLDEIVWVVDPCNDTLENMAAYLGQYANEYFQNTDIICSIYLPGSLPSLPMASEVRHNIFLAFEESLTNILKHSKAGRVRIEMKLAGSGFEIAVSDDGTGFARPGSTNAAGREPGADGLKNMRSRMAAVGGSCEVDSEPGKGTTIRLCAPLLQNPA